MAWMRKLSNGLKMETAIFMLVFSLTLFSSESDGTGLGGEGEGDGDGLKPMKWVLGSRPPRCLNKCLSCRPCKAVLVVVSEHRHKNAAEEESGEKEDSYYLLLWKCKCKDKFFHP